MNYIEDISFFYHAKPSITLAATPLLLGRVQLQAQGHWRWQGNTQTATVAFDAFSLQATGLFHQADWQLPALHIPVLEGLRREATWQTSYLDSDLRIGRGATGNLFVFARLLRSSPVYKP
ncbi:hypothetical protein H6F88_18615 [Oculatella sp. FACHB-28]|uniref:PAP/fibrillin family protein n=1 Tax=Oculatella sp. FACHB-28 TaxID=2692845 RepID=UPI00168A27EA|nr:PAP/fibrillin family protein [Oculatella sp. FACHB-28]MBD2058004.1 hypothetical protein [Oculatella sp. FACHB-28]